MSVRSVPSAAWLCALVACINAVAWSLITPPFQVPDEPEHVAYVKHLAATGRLPTHSGNFSVEEQVGLEDLEVQAVAEQQENETIASQAEVSQLQRDLATAQRVEGQGGEYAGVAASEPPLYYALETVPYSLGSGLLGRLELMRLLSALMGGLTALFAFMFVREALPGVAWAWTVGGLGVALVPLLGFMSGAVNPDAMLCTVTAALFYCLARAFRRGITRPLALVVGCLVAIGFATKLNFVGVAPGALLGLIVACVRARAARGRAAYVWLGLALAIALSPPAVYVVAHLVSSGHALGIVSSAFHFSHGSLWRRLGYVWQLYLPRLPGMHADFAGVFTTRQIWFDAYLGQYGWLDTGFPGWVEDLALIPALLIAALCLRSLGAGRGVLRARAVELGVYAVMSVGLLVLIGLDSYIAFPKYGAEFGQARYLLPLVPLLGVVLALAARGAPRRWGPVVGVGIVVLFLAHDLLSQLQVIARFYG